MFLDRLREMLIWTFPTGESACHNALCVFCVACVMQHLFNKGRQKCVVIDNVAYTVTMELYFSLLLRDILAGGSTSFMCAILGINCRPCQCRPRDDAK